MEPEGEFGVGESLVNPSRLRSRPNLLVLPLLSFLSRSSSVEEDAGSSGNGNCDKNMHSLKLSRSMANAIFVMLAYVVLDSSSSRSDLLTRYACLLMVFLYSFISLSMILR